MMHKINNDKIDNSIILLNAVANYDDCYISL